MHSGSTVQNRQMFNIICELPETVARTLVPRMRVVKGTGKAINYLTPPRILLALVTAWLRRGRWFDDEVSIGCYFENKSIHTSNVIKELSMHIRINAHRYSTDTTLTRY